MDDRMNQNGVRNGIGPPIEQSNVGPVSAHRLWNRGWMARMVILGFRNEDLISSDRFDFGHAASVELENNRHALGCAACITGECTRPAHVANDPTYNAVIWSAIIYANTDHMTGDIK